MYISDYGYAASPENWNTNLDSYNNDTNRNNNWMYMGLNEWTITHRSDNSTNVFGVLEAGHVSSYGAFSSNIGVRPFFYLESQVTYTGGTGTQTDPYRIA